MKLTVLGAAMLFPSAALAQTLTLDTMLSEAREGVNDTVQLMPSYLGEPIAQNTDEHLASQRGSNAVSRPRSKKAQEGGGRWRKRSTF